ncbi:hypothetical protein [Corynebacterium comes]|uniref:Uncharacterized protein n=1 Tax=Corynebacterium comes TaxID=2675218 RepID=A0A6B8W2U1_9CORY|nr:hypothetical protein [Corynebacterium comes]QGU05246.1 hypothetical protein CETAM_09985 [Corynebacterium comes]
MDLKQRAITQQFTVELVRAMPQLSIPQAVSAAMQLADSMDLPRVRDFGALVGLVNGLQLRPAAEWEAFGYEPTERAVAVRLEVPHEAAAPTPGKEHLPERAWDGRIRFEDHYLSVHTRRVHPPGMHLCDYRDAVGGWRKRLGYVTEPTLAYAEFTSAAAEKKMPMRRVEMLGNLWKIGAVATWEKDWEGETSWCYVDQRPSPGESPDPMLNDSDAWYRLRINPDVGRDVIVEIARCLAEIHLGYVEKLWGPTVEGGTQRGPESEAAAYIALERLWIPQRSRRTDWYHRYVAGEPMPNQFRWSEVFRAAEAVEDLLRGDTAPVTA